MVLLSFEEQISPTGRVQNHSAFVLSSLVRLYGNPKQCSYEACKNEGC